MSKVEDDEVANITNSIISGDKIFITEDDESSNKEKNGMGETIDKDNLESYSDPDANLSMSNEKLTEEQLENEKEEENEIKLELTKGLDSLSIATDCSEEIKEDDSTPTDEIDFRNDDWRLKHRHVFILSEAGKPIYSRHGQEDKLSTMFGLLQALVSVVQDSGDSMRAIRAGQNNIVFLLKSPLILVCVTRLGECVTQVQMNLSYFYNQIVSILTSKQLESIYEKRRNYDLRRLLAGSERLLNNLGSLIEIDPCFTLDAIKCLPLNPNVRESIVNAVVSSLQKVKDVVFAILLAKRQLISLVRMKKFFMYPRDLHLIINLIDGSESFKTAESWTPICLPGFDSSGFLHAHVSYLEDSQACLVLLTADRDSFFTLSEAKQKIVEKLRKGQTLDHLNIAIDQTTWPSPSAVGIREIRHFVYKSRAIAQFTSSLLETPYYSIEDLKKINSTYFRLHSRLQSQSRPIKLIYVTGETENWFAWMTSNFELLACLEPLVTKANATNAVNKLIKWVKKEEEKIFCVNSPTF